MAENEQGQEKTEEATEKRIKDSRERGQVPRSREFNTFFMMFVSGLTLLFFGGGLVSDLLKIIRESLSPTRAEIFDPKYLMISFSDFT